MLFDGLRLLFSNWRLTLVQVLPAMWIWVAMLDLKAHVFNGKEFQTWHAPVELLLVARSRSSPPRRSTSTRSLRSRSRSPVRRDQAGVHARATATSPSCPAPDSPSGVMLGVSAIVVPRWGSYWFTLSLGIVIGVMMLTYVTVPARIVGIKPPGLRRDKLAAGLIAGTLGAIVCTPPYMIGRSGILLLGSHVVPVPLGVVLLALGLTLQAGATGAVKAIKMSAKLAAGNATHPAARSRTAAGGA